MRALAGTTVAVVVGAGLLPVALAPAAQAAGTVTAAASEPETVVLAGARWLPAGETLLTAGSDGYVARDEAGTISWVHEADGSRAPVGPPGAVSRFNQGVWAWQQSTSPVKVQLEDLESGDIDTLSPPAGQIWTTGFTHDALLTWQPASSGVPLHVIRAGDHGTVTDRPVDGVPAGAAFSGRLAQSGHLAVIALTVAGAWHTYLLDYETASVREIFAGNSAAQVSAVVIGATRVVGYGVTGTTAYSVRLDDPAGTVEQTPYPAAVTSDATRPVPVPVGDRILFVRAQPSGSSVGLPLLSVPVGGGDAQTLLTRSYASYAVAPDGSVLVVGGSGPEDWAVRRITAVPGADPAVASVTPLPAVAARTYGLTYSGGRLAYSSDTASTSPLPRRDVSPGADPSVTAPTSLWGFPPPLETCATATSTHSCRHLQGLGTGTVAFLDRGSIESPVSTNGFEVADLGTTAASTLTDGSESYVIANTPSTGKQTVADLEQAYADNVVLTRPITASAVWGSTLWVPGTVAGTVRPYDLRTRTFGATVTTAAKCGTAFKELQADGRWLYWSCGTTAGIHDRQTGKDVPVPAGTVGDALLGDGYLVRHDAASGSLVLTDVHSGAAVTSTLASLPVTITADRNVLWSVDKYGGGVAYVDASQNIHVLPLADLPRSPLSLMGSAVEGGVDLSPAFTSGEPSWTPQWTFSRPVASWTLTLKNAAGAVVMTRSGTGTAAAPLGTRISASWDVKLASGKLAPNGAYKWTLTAVPGDGQGAASTTTGTLTVSGWAQGHDYTGDGTADLLGLTTSGRLDTRFGTAAGGLTPGFTGAGWSTSDTFVAFGDLDGDRYNDLLVRDSSGKLWLYPGNAKAAFTPGMPHTALGTGYQQYNLLVSAGDMNGDGRPDLLARDSAGRLWLHAGTAAGGLAARTLVGTGYQQYTLIAGAVGLSDASGYRPPGEIIARDASGVLWRHVTDGKGHFKPRARIGSGWNAYNSLTTVEMLAPGGAESVLARDTRGGLWRIDDNGNGTLTRRTWEGGGWQVYARLF